MTGGMVQLAAIGSQDAFLHADPQVTWWRQIWRRSTAFAMEAVEMAFSAPPDFGRKTSVALSRTADLAHKAWLQISLPDLADYYTSAMTARSTQPRLIRGFRTSPTTATVRVEPPTTGTFTQIRIVVATATAGYTAGAQLALVTKLTGAFQDISLTGLVAGSPGPIVEAVYVSGGTLSEASEPRQVLNLKWTNAIGFAVVDGAEYECGGARIEKIPNSEFFDVWSELTEKEEHRAGLHDAVGKYDDYDITDNAKSQRAARVYYVPMLFSWCKSPSLAIPTVALTYHEARVNFSFRDALECIKCDVPVSQLVSNTGEAIAFKDCRFYVDVVYLDTIERRKFATTPAEFLIDQIQFLGDVTISQFDAPGATKKISLDGFQHPVKELIFTYSGFGKYQRDAVDGNEWFDYELPAPYRGEEIFESVRLTINGTERVSARPGRYFSLVQPFQHHTRTPKKSVHVYSFALAPETTNPSGDMNFSRLESASLHVTLSPNIDARGGRIKIWAIGQNIFRVSQGMGGLAFTG